MRVEDLDTPRLRAGSERRILEDLHWLGMDWDEGPEGPYGPYRQSERTALYEAALGLLDARGLTYACDCSRKEIALAASAPHPGEEGPIYPGTCRHAPRDRVFRRPPAMRLLVPAGTKVRFTDAVFGEHEIDLATEIGDFVLRRGDGVFAYQLAVVVDDLAQGITQVVRGADLLSSTARQVFLAACLGAKAPSFAHAPLLVGSGGEKLAKRARGIPVRDHRSVGIDPRRLVARLARALGLADDGEVRLAPSDLVARFSWDRVAKGPIEVDPSWNLTSSLG